VTTRLLIEPEADQELEEAALRYEEERPGLGQKFLDAVAASVERVRRFPQAGTTVPFVPLDLPARRVSVKGFPYHVVYLTTADLIRVLAFAHYRRRPGYWFDRHRL
jgi:plasmid stabilization system protein ParE